MNTITVGNAYAYSTDSMIDMLHGFGMDNCDIETMKGFLNADELEDAEHTANVREQEARYYEARLDEVQSALNEVLNMIDDALDMQRITKTRERMEAMRRVIMNA